MQCHHVKEMRKKTDNHVGITQELNSTGKLTYIAGDVWFYAFSARACFSAA